MRAYLRSPTRKGGMDSSLPYASGSASALALRFVGGGLVTSRGGWLGSRRRGSRFRLAEQGLDVFAELLELALSGAKLHFQLIAFLHDALPHVQFLLYAGPLLLRRRQ